MRIPQGATPPAGLVRDDGGEAAQAGAIGQTRRPKGQSRRARHVPLRRCRRKVGDSPTLICSPRGVRHFPHTPMEGVRASLARFLRGLQNRSQPLPPLDRRSTVRRSWSHCLKTSFRALGPPRIQTTCWAFDATRKLSICYEIRSRRPERGSMTSKNHQYRFGYKAWSARLFWNDR